MEPRDDGRRVAPAVAGGAYWSALLASIDHREAAIREHVDTMTAVLMPRVARVVAVAVRAGVTHEEVAAAARPLDRMARMVSAHLVDLAGDWHDAHVPLRRAAKGSDADWLSYPPVHDAHLDAWRATRADGGGVLRLDARGLIVGGRVPDIERVGTMTDAELNLLLKRFGVGRDRGEMLAEAVRRRAARLVAADHPDPALVDRVMDDAERAVRADLRQAAKAAVRGYRNVASGWEDDTVLRWISRLPAGNVCPSCEDRHGRQRTWAQWQREGTPGNANTLCQDECLCELGEV